MVKWFWVKIQISSNFYVLRINGKNIIWEMLQKKEVICLQQMFVPTYSHSSTDSNYFASYFENIFWNMSQHIRKVAP